METLKGIAKGSCPVCGKGKIFKTNYQWYKTPEMNKSCPHCHFVYEKEPGFFWGAMYVSYGIGIAVSLAIFGLCQFIFTDPFDLRIIPLVTLSLLSISLINYRYSRIIWIYLFAPKKNNDLTVSIED